MQSYIFYLKTKKNEYCFETKKTKTENTELVFLILKFVEITGLEPVTSTLPVSRSSQMS